MNLKVLMLIMIYYAIIIASVLIPGSALNQNFQVANVFNDSALTSEEIDTGGLFGTGVDFGRFFGFVTIGVGLPADTPDWFQFLFALWQSLWLIFTVGFVISSIWDG